MIVRTYDEMKIRGILLREEMKPYAVVDGVDIETCDLHVHQIYYLLSEAGLFAYNIHTPTVVEVHACVYSGYRGAALQYCQESLRWVFENLSQDKVIAFITVENQAAIKFAVKNGFKLEGIVIKSLKLNGILHDQYLFGLGRQTCQ